MLTGVSVVQMQHSYASLQVMDTLLLLMNHATTQLLLEPHGHGDAPNCKGCSQFCSCAFGVKPTSTQLDGQAEKAGDMHSTQAWLEMLAWCRRGCKTIWCLQSHNSYNAVTLFK